MSERQFYHLFDLCQLFATTTDIVIADRIERIFFFFSLNRFSFAMNDSIGRHNTEGRGVRLYNFELDCSHTASHYKQVSLMYGSIRFQKIRLKIDVKYTSSESFDRIIDWEDMYSFTVLDIRTGLNTDYIS
jgi:hypothetical protein